MKSLILATTVAAVFSWGCAAQAQIVEQPIPGDPVRIDTGKVAGKVLPSGSASRSCAART